MNSFSVELDDLISKWKALGADVGEMSADLQGAADGLADEDNANAGDD